MINPGVVAAILYNTIQYNTLQYCYHNTGIDHQDFKFSVF